MGCFYCDEHHEGREAVMRPIGEMKGGMLYLFLDQTHKGRCVLALKGHRKELFDCDPQERADIIEDLVQVSKAITELFGCDKINFGAYGDTNPHFHFHIVPKYKDGPEFGGSFQINYSDPYYPSEEEYLETINALKNKLGI